MGSTPNPAPSSDQPSGQGADSGTAAAPAYRLASVVLNVFELEQPVGFYCDLLGLAVSHRTATAALLVSREGSQLYLRSLSPHAEHVIGGIGVHSVIWTAPSAVELRRCEQLLKDRHLHTTTQAAEGFVWVEGRDPSGNTVVVTHPGPEEAVRRRIISRVYAW
ncbi:catechol-2,3-dioxygenase [Streptacidiphilus sp. MAP12-16]|uniref:VOC family protein n=1 Tax=Streptacidiphilus sp. MAP12-16 TaxID=3156300 RepID=UPI0035163C2F